MEREQLALEIARETGFDLAGIAPVRPPKAAARFERWLDAGHHGSMKYLERNRDRIVDPGRVLPTGKSLLVLGLAHSRAAVALDDGARVARYAAGRDYHNVMGRMLAKLARRLASEGFGGRARRIVDAGPLLERSHASEAGIGFESKAANLLHPQFGPWFFLGELILEIELASTSGPAPGSCGSCRACIDACPTSAILEPGVVDARRCISYQTIENRGPIPEELRPQLGAWAFGCDVCSEICPWGRKSEDLSARFGNHAAIAEAGMVEWITVGARFEPWLEGSPLKRSRRAGLARNAAIVLGNRPSEVGQVTLLRALSFDPAPLVREAAAWSLAHGYGGDSSTRNALEHAAERETEPSTQAAIARWRSKCR